MSGIPLLEADRLILTPLQQGIIQTVAKESAVLEVLPFVDINGSALSYTQEGALATVNFRDINETYTGTNPTFINKVESLSLLGGTVEVDRFIQLTQNIHDVRAEATASKAKAIANEFTRVFFAGDISKNPLEFNGLESRLIPENDVDAAGWEISSGMIHQLMDKVMGGADVLFMNKRTRRHLTAIFEAQSTIIQIGQDAFGRQIKKFGDVRIAVVEDIYLPDDSIYAVNLGKDTGVVGIQNNSVLASDNGLRGTIYETLIEWYVSIVDMNPKGFARLHNFTLE